MTRPFAHLRLLLAWIPLAILMCCGAPPAGAAPKKAIWGPVATAGVSQFPIYDDLDVDLFQTQINWRLTAPTRPAVATDPNDPAYRWPADLDLAVAEGSRYGIEILVMALQTPAWANGGKSHQTPPTNPDDYAQFMEAVAKRYPTIRHFMVWGEPIRGANYTVTPSEYRNYYVKSGNAKGKLKAFKSTQRREARGYAQLVDATYGRVKALNRQNMIIGGNTTTSGDVDPFNWARFMRLGNGKPPRMDLFGHNPFGTRGPDLRKRQILPGTADMSDLDVFIPWVEKYQQRSGRNRKLRLFVSEYTAPTDASGFEFAYFVTRKLQAQWLRAAWRITKSEKLYGLGWIGLNDVVRADGEQSPTGLIDAKGVKKPSYGAFRALR
jgi:hypothetical protein